MKNNTREYNIYDMAEGTLFVYDIGNDTLEIIEDFDMGGTHMICAVLTDDDVVDVTGDPDHETWIMRATLKLSDLIKEEIIGDIFKKFEEVLSEYEDEDEEDEDVCGVNIADLLLDFDKENKSNNQLHPEHYNRGLEVIDFTNLYNLNGNEFNIVKYLLRYPFKGTPIEDLNKALNYTNFEIRRLDYGESIMIDANRTIDKDTLTTWQLEFKDSFLTSWKPYFNDSEWAFIYHIINDIHYIHAYEVRLDYRLDILYSIQNDIEDLIEVVKNNG